MPYKEVDFREGWNIQIGSNEVTNWSRNSFNPSTYGGFKPAIYLTYLPSFFIIAFSISSVTIV